MANPKPHTVEMSATEKAQRARDAHKDTRNEIIAVAAVLARVWPSWIAPAKRPDPLFPLVLCIESPAGRLAYRLAEDDMPALEHVAHRQKNDGVSCSKIERLGRLSDLGVNGW